MAFRRHLASLGLGIAEAMDTAQRGMGLDWPGALELIRRTKQEMPDALVFNGCGTDHLDPRDARRSMTSGDAYLEQIDAIQEAGGRIILMASRALAKVAKSPDDYLAVYRDVLARCDQPVILHWLGEMFDPALAGYWGADDFDGALETALAVIDAEQVQGRRHQDLAARQGQGNRHAPPPAGRREDVYRRRLQLSRTDRRRRARAIRTRCSASSIRSRRPPPMRCRGLAAGDKAGFRAVLDPTVPLARLIFRAPTQYYKTGVVFLAWLNGFQDHFVMLDGAQAMRPLPYFTEIFRLADGCGLLRDPELAVDAHEVAADALRRLKCATSATVIPRWRSTPRRSATMSRGRAPAGRRSRSSTPAPNLGWRHRLLAARDRRRAVPIGEHARRAGSAGHRLCAARPFWSGRWRRRPRAGILDDFEASIDMAAGLGAEVLTIVVGGVEPGTKGVSESLKRVGETVARMAPFAAQRNVKLALEPLNPVYGGDRSCLVTVRDAVDLCDAIDHPAVGIAVDVYHVWWDTTCAAIAARRQERILGYHLCDWLADTRDVLLDRGMMGDGVADLKGIRAAVEAAGYDGLCEVEIFSANDWWKSPPREVLQTCIERFRSVC